MNKYPLDLTKAKKYLQGILPEVGKCISTNFYKGNIRKRKKGPGNYVTEIDTWAEDIIKSKLEKEYSNISILTEERSPKDYTNINFKDPIWVIDPIDGTTNFIKGYPNFATSIGLVCNYQPILGVVYNPLSEELFTAQADMPFALRNGNKMVSSIIKILNEASVCVNLSYEISECQKMFKMLYLLCDKVADIKILGSTVNDLISVAQGKTDIYFQLGAFPWDLAAASLIVAKSGYEICTFEGREWNILSPNIIAVNKFLHKKMLNLLGIISNET